jgi:hypothetical protein
MKVPCAHMQERVEQDSQMTVHVALFATESWAKAVCLASRAIPAGKGNGTRGSGVKRKMTAGLALVGPLPVAVALAPCFKLGRAEPRCL